MLDRAVNMTGWVAVMTDRVWQSRIKLLVCGNVRIIILIYFILANARLWCLYHPMLCFPVGADRRIPRRKVRVSVRSASQ